MSGAGEPAIWPAYPTFPRIQFRFASGSLQRRVGCELDSWIMLGDDGLESKDDVRVFSLIVLARFVCSVASGAASASGGNSGSNAPTLSCCSEDAAAATASSRQGTPSRRYWRNS